MPEYIDPMMAQMLQQQMMTGQIDMASNKVGQAESDKNDQYAMAGEAGGAAPVADPYFLLLSPEERRRRREQERLQMRQMQQQQGIAGGAYPNLNPFAQQWGF